MEQKKVSAGTIARTVVLVLALVNQVLVSLGYKIIPVEEDTVYELLSSVLTIGAALVAWWKNNSFTQKAITADEYLHGKTDTLPTDDPDDAEDTEDTES